MLRRSLIVLIVWGTVGSSGPPIKGRKPQTGRGHGLIRYQDGSEELYDVEEDPHEWTNLTGNPGYDEAKSRLARWLPKTDAPSAPTKGAFHVDPAMYIWQRRANSDSR